jgi:ATP-dependent phosphofructokinase / diphosphate-dependent phosphofructokinase
LHGKHETCTHNGCPPGGDPGDHPRQLLHDGTMLGTSRTNPFDGPNGGALKIKSTLESLGIDALVAIGGEGTLAAAKRLSQEGLNIVGVPKTVDNDLAATDYTFGFDTAVQIATEAIDRLRTTGESHHRCMVAEVTPYSASGVRTVQANAAGLALPRFDRANLPE